MSQVPTGLKYTEEHEWVRKTDAGTYRIGITHHAQDQLGDIVFIGDLAEVGEKVETGDVVGVVESVKATSDIYAPISGKVVAVNEELAEEPERANKSPYGDGWLLEIKSSEPEELDGLLDVDRYTDLIES